MHLSGHMGRCMNLDDLQAVALRLDDASKYLHAFDNAGQRLHIERGCENV